jgi:addiction module RelE/StbE family toxin
MRIVWTRRARRHLQAAYEYWARQSSESAADEMLERIFCAVELLENHPQIGRQGRISGTRELVLTPLPFLLAYRVRRARIEIIALLHAARKWPGHF